MMSREMDPDFNKLHAFKIWYSDSTYIGRTKEDWEKAPEDDVQVVMIYFKGRDGMGRRTRLHAFGCDYYALDDTLNFSSHFDDREKVSGHVLKGKYMDYDKFIDLKKRSFEDYGEEWLDV